MPSHDRKRHATGTRTPGIFYRLDRHGERAYEITWRTRDGRQRWLRVHGDLEAAKEALAARHREVRTTPHSSTSLTVRELVEEYRRSDSFLDLRPASKERYLRDLRLYALPALGDVRVADLTTRTLADWLHDLRQLEHTRGKEPLSPASRRAACTPIRRALKYAVQRGYIAMNPATELELPRQERKDVRVLDGIELARLFEHCPERSRLMLQVKAFTGLRSAELRGLVWADLDLERGRVRVNKQLDDKARGERVAPKTKQAVRELPLRGKELEAIRDLHAQRSEWGDTHGFVFQHDARPFTVGWLSNDFHRAVKRAGIDDQGKRLTPHSLRHGYGSMLIAAGLDVALVSRRMGHSTVAITLAVYTHEFESRRTEDDAKVLEAIETFA